MAVFHNSFLFLRPSISPKKNCILLQWTSRSEITDPLAVALLWVFTVSNHCILTVARPWTKLIMGKMQVCIYLSSRGCCRTFIIHCSSKDFHQSFDQRFYKTSSHSLHAVVDSELEQVVEVLQKNENTNYLACYKVYFWDWIVTRGEESRFGSCTLLMYSILK